jgi:uncharacterized membrane protein YhiD involved in acid resistance
MNSELTYLFLSVAIGLLTTLVAYIYTKTIKDTERRLGKTEDTVKEIEENYIDRFDSIKEKLSDVEHNILSKLTETRHSANEKMQKMQFQTDLNCKDIEYLKLSCEKIKNKMERIDGQSH